jgi:hypothetical protein
MAENYHNPISQLVSDTSGEVDSNLLNDLSNIEVAYLLAHARARENPDYSLGRLLTPNGTLFLLNTMSKYLSEMADTSHLTMNKTEKVISQLGRYATGTFGTLTILPARQITIEKALIVEHKWPHLLAGTSNEITKLGSLYLDKEIQRHGKRLRIA